MRRLLQFGLIGFLLAVILLLFFKTVYVSRITLQVGEGVKQASGENKLHLDPDERDDMPLIWPENDLSGDVFHFVYGDQQKIDFPHARLIWAQQAAGVITSVQVTGPEATTTIGNAYAAVQDLSRQLTAAGWQTVRVAPSLPTLLASIKSRSVDKNLTEYKKGSLRARISIDTPGVVDVDHVETGKYLIYKINFIDEAMQEVQKNKMYQQRQKVNGTVNSSVPLSFWLSQQ